MKHLVSALVITAGLTVLSPLQAAELNSPQQKFSYAMGVNLGNLLKSQGITDVDSDAFTMALKDVMQGNPLQLNLSEMKTAIEQRQKQLISEAQQDASNNLEKGRKFLAENANKPGVTVLENGMQYQVIKNGDGDMPAATDNVSVHYHGTLINGDVFDSSVDRGEPASFALNRVIPGFREALTRMKTGAKWKVFVPSDLAYGESGAGGKIGPNETLIFEIELLNIN